MTNTYKLFKIKGFPKIKIGKKYFIEEKELQKYLKEHSESQIFLNQGRNWGRKSEKR